MLLSTINPIDFITSLNKDNKKEKTKKTDSKDMEPPDNSSETTELTKTKIKKERLTKFERVVDSLFRFFTNCLQVIGPLFAISLICFILFTYISTLKCIVPFWRRKFGRWFTRPLQILQFIQVLYILFNYILATIVKPGSVLDIKNSQYYKTHSAYRSTSLVLPQITIQLRSSNEGSHEILWKKCKYCNEIKPLRTHHCSICGSCVIKMDHHCPWVNNCIGQNNQRYFLLFIFHLFFYAFFIAVLSIPMIFSGYFFKSENEFRMICVLSIAGVLILIFFNSWNWFLALQNATTIEFFGQKSGMNVSNGIDKFDFGDIKQNLFYVFGTKNVFEILFVPSIKKLPFSGLEWSRHFDRNFHIDGIVDVNDTDDIAIDINI